MKTRLLLTFILALSLLGLTATPSLAGLAPDEAQALKLALPDIPPPLNGIAPKAEEFVNSVYMREGTLFNQKVTLFIYFQRRGMAPVPVIAVTGIPSLTARELFGDIAPDVGLNKPVLFWTKGDGSFFNLKGDGTLYKQSMPAQLRNYVEKNLWMPDAVLTASGFNLYGKLASGFVGEFMNSVTTVNLNDFIVGIAKIKEKVDTKGEKSKDEQKPASGHAVSLSLASGKRWNNPFGLANTEISGGTVRITSAGTNRSLEAWGIAGIGNEKKPFTFYVKNEYLGKIPTSQSLGFDVSSASLQDFFMLLGVAGSTLGLPAILLPPQLPLTMVMLKNPVYEAPKDPSSPLDFDKMMFKGTRKAEGAGELITHAQGSVFGQSVAAIDLNAAKTGVTGAAAVGATLGPLNLSSAKFYLDVGLKVEPPPSMGLKATSAIFGDIDLKANTAGLQLKVPAQCPLRPVGFSAALNNLALTDFPIQPELKDCFSEEIGKFVDGATDVGSDAVDTASQVALDVADTAMSLGNEAVQAANTLQAQRIVAWGPALVSHAAEIKSAKDAVGAAEKAFNDAEKKIKQLGDDIRSLGNEIDSLTNKIENLLRQAWGFVTGEVNKLKRDKSKKQAKRDTKRTELADAEKRKKDAQTAVDNAKTAALAEIPGPNVAGDVARLSEEWRGMETQIQVQAQIGRYAAGIAEDVKNPAKRREILATLSKEEFVNQRKASLATEFATLAHALTPQDGKLPLDSYLANAKRAMLTAAVSKQIEDETENALKETVTNLPTMAFDMPVSVEYSHTESNTNYKFCLESWANNAGIWLATTCNPKKLAPYNQVFRFTAGGKIEMETDRTKCMAMKSALPSVVPCDTAERFFFDPIDGMIRYLPGNSDKPSCLMLSRQSSGLFVSPAACPESGTTDAVGPWRLAPVSAPPQVRTAVLKSTGRAMATGQKRPSDARRTNLAPLHLK